MRTNIANITNIKFKLTILALALVTLLMIFSNDVIPQVSKFTVLAYTIGGLVVLAASLFAVIMVKANINQFILNHGGTDTAWLWFNRNPQGLEQTQGNKE